MERKTLVEEQCMKEEAEVEKHCGHHTRENAGMSSERWVRISPVENLRIPEQGSSTQGKSGPKARLKSVVDGQQVENPVPIQSVRKWGRRRIIRAPSWWGVQAQRMESRQIRFPRSLKRDADRKQVEKLITPHCQEKPLQEKYRPYRKPTQVGEERILRRAEKPLLRNSAKWPRNFGRRGAPVKGGRSEKAQATVYQKHKFLRSRKTKYRSWHLPGAGRLREKVSISEA